MSNLLKVNLVMVEVLVVVIIVVIVAYRWRGVSEESPAKKL